jgi:citrate synthase
LIYSIESVNIDCWINIPMPDLFLTAAEAAAALGVQRATLYAYVSRGLLRSEEDPRGRGRRYPAADVEALRQRAAGRRDPSVVARDALAWGVPVLDSDLTLIAGGRLYYRGHDVVELARRGETLERIAALLWLGSLDAPLPAAGPREPWSGDRGLGDQPPVTTTLPIPPPAGIAAASWRPFQRLMACLPLASANDPMAYDLRPGPVVAAGARLLPLVASLAAGREGSWRAAEILARGWLPAQAGGAGKRLADGSSDPHHTDDAGDTHSAGGGSLAGDAMYAGNVGHVSDAGEVQEVARLIDAALVLSADHELNVSAFTARCVASARAPLAAVVAGGLAALGGSRHGGYTERVAALCDEMAPTTSQGTPATRPAKAGGAQVAAGRSAAGRAVTAKAAATRSAPVSGVAALRARLADRLRRGEEIPGFGHPLYPEGDPRGRLLLELAAAHRPRSREVGQALALAEAALALLGERPTLDFGLVALARALQLPAGAPLALFAVGRTTGWIAHALEQYADPRLIRPRARYVGPDPPPNDPAARKGSGGPPPRA